MRRCEEAGCTSKHRGCWNGHCHCTI